ncbi:uncharacterized protein PV07_04570 [Cladophialophora immunda]|uniref:RNase H type-1 domain-containing protein n=1 Tax=Cladophialophora immunda TaxID=569365 RepID=A0A0D2CT46_9EURO|nr:uncharacterized protein PV07_04570 [Cladophialophora immunda]KIW33075.1 hypothetical protein PV07_04570 [Cladophialophora immunda]
MRKWQKNGFRTDRRTPVANSDLLKSLSKMVNLIQDDLSVSVYFWHVPRCFNKEADRLAKESLTAGNIKDFEVEF